MTLERRVADLVQNVEGQFEHLQELLRADLEFAAFEQPLTARPSVLGQMIGSVLSNEELVGSLKGLGGRLGMLQKDLRQGSLRLGNGQAYFPQTRNGLLSDFFIS